MAEKSSWLRRIAAGGGLVLLLAAPLAMAQKPVATAPPAGSPPAAPLLQHLVSGYMYAKTWRLHFVGPRSWPYDRSMTKSRQIAGIFHPKNWDAPDFVPMIYVLVDHRDQQTPSINSEMKADVARTLRYEPKTRVLVARGLEDRAGHPVLTRVFVNGRSWQAVAYVDQPPVFLVGPRCAAAMRCSASR